MDLSLRKVFLPRVVLLAILNGHRMVQNLCSFPPGMTMPLSACSQEKTNQFNGWRRTFRVMDRRDGHQTERASFLLGHQEQAVRPTHCFSVVTTRGLYGQLMLPREIQK